MVSMRESASRGVLAWTVRQRPVVARVHGLEHVQGLSAADLADDDPVGPHAQRVADELANGDLALAFDVLRSGLESEDVTLVEPELCGVFDRENSFVVRDRRRERVESVVLPEPVPPEMSTFSSARMHAARNSTDSVESVPSRTRSVRSSRLLRELADREQRPAERKRRDDRIHAAAVRQASVDHRRRFVQPPTDLRHNLVDDPPEVGVVGETDRRLVQPPLTLDPDVVWAVDHDLGDALVRQEPLERPVSEDVVRNLGGQAFSVVAGQPVLASEMRLDIVGNPLVEGGRLHARVEELRAEVADHCEVDAVLDLCKWVSAGRLSDRANGGKTFVEFHQDFLRRRWTRRRSWRLGSIRCRWPRGAGRTSPPRTSAWQKRWAFLRSRNARYPDRSAPRCRAYARRRRGRLPA